MRDEASNQEFADQLRAAVLGASRREEIARPVEAVYQALADAVAVRRPVCRASGRCCRFDEFGHRLYVTTLESAKFVADLRRATEEATVRGGVKVEAGGKLSLPVVEVGKLALASDGGGCRFQMGGLCGVHALRPMGCRIYFCDETSTAWQHELYEKLHGRLRALHEELKVPYFYVEWRLALQVCL